MEFLPIFLNVKNKNILVVGGSNAAYIKIKGLIEYNSNICVIAPYICNCIYEFEKNGLIKIKQREFKSSDLDNTFIVIAATKKELNKEIIDLANDRGILCSSVNRDINTDFIFPSHKKNAGITVAVSTSGKYPMLAQKICDEINIYDEEKLKFLEEKRNFILKSIPDKSKQKIVLKKLIEDNILNSPNFKEKIDTLINYYFLNK